MADYFVSNSGSNTSPYDTWAKAATSLQTALTAASTAGDRVIIQYNAVPSGDAELAASVTYTIGANTSIISASNDGGSSWTPTKMGDSYWVGNSSTASRSVALSCSDSFYAYGLTLRSGATTTNYLSVGVGNANDGLDATLEECHFWLSGSSSTNKIRLFPGGNANFNANIKLVNPKFTFAHASQTIIVAANVESYGGVLAGTAQTNVFELANIVPAQATYQFDGLDLSNSESATIVPNSSQGATRWYFSNCKLPTAYTLLAAQTKSNKAFATVFLSNCSSGDSHFEFAYADSFGTLTAVTSPYFNDGASFDGTNPVCWKIVTTANPSFATPFVTPWIEKYHSGTSAITPYLEILRNDSTTAFKNDEVWGEFSAQATSGSVLPVFKNDRRALNAAAANQDAGAGLASWTGEGGSAWSGKIDSGSSVTPAEIGMLRARVCVGAPNATVYVDPFIRT